MLAIGLFIFSISSWFHLGRWYLTKTFFVSSRLSFYCHRVANSSLVILCVSVVLVVTFPFSFLILLIWVLPPCFFLLLLLFHLANGLSILLILLIFVKNQFLVSLIFVIVFFVFTSFISALIFFLSFLLITLSFVCSCFSSYFRCKVKLFEIFLVFWGKTKLL